MAMFDADNLRICTRCRDRETTSPSGICHVCREQDMIDDAVPDGPIVWAGDDDDDWDELMEDINDDPRTEEEIADLLDAGICPECGAELDICGHAELFEYPDDGHTCYWLEIEVDDDDE